MGHDMVAGAKSDPLQYRAQRRRRPNHAILDQVHMRQVTRPRQMAATGTITRVLAGELRARPRIEHMRATVELIPSKSRGRPARPTLTPTPPGNRQRMAVLPTAARSPMQGQASRRSG